MSKVYFVYFNPYNYFPPPLPFIKLVKHAVVAYKFHNLKIFKTNYKVFSDIKENIIC